LGIHAKGRLVGRVVTEAMPGGKVPAYVSRTLRSKPGKNGLQTVLRYQAVGKARYFDAGGFPGLTVGLP
jgi:hypothetical protein